jgi:hypothetical protein
MPKRNRGEEGAATEATRATGERIREIMRLLSPGAALGEVDRLLSFSDFRRLIEKRTPGVSISESALVRYAKGEREAPPSLLTAIAAVDPLKRGPIWLAGWEQADAQSVQNSVAPAPQNHDPKRLPPTMPMPGWVDPAAVAHPALPHKKRRGA